jgi:hypothetical protein
MTFVRSAVLITATFGVFGCATAASAWVSQPEPGPFAHDEVTGATAELPIEALDEPHTSRLVSELDGDSSPRGRPRLDRTVTLGETIVAYSERNDAPIGERGPVNVTINNYVTTTPSSYDGYYGGPYLGAFRPHHGASHPAQPIVRPTPIAPTHPGQSWPALPNHGTSFPFKTAPASPWR